MIEATLAPEARQAVADVLVDLSWALDTGDVSRFAAAFAPGADFVLEAGAERHRIAGREELVADFRARLEGGHTGTQHRMSNHLFIPESDGSCTVWSYWATSLRAPDTGEVGLTGTGWICDRLVEDAEGWRIAHHHVGLWRDRMDHPLSGGACC
jgi:3-phenylpropionate/cinnamic acid dioxygenase small subunit